MRDACATASEKRVIYDLRLEFCKMQENIPGVYYQINTIINNYIDPRILMTFVKSKYNNISYFYTKNTLNNFLWALEEVEKEPFVY